MRKWRYVIEKAKHFGGELNVTGFWYFVEKILLRFEKFDNPEFFSGTKTSGLSRYDCILSVFCVSDIFGIYIKCLLIGLVLKVGY